MAKKSLDTDYFYRYSRYFPYVIFSTSVLLYLNTLGHEYTQDDAIAIYNNQFTKAGLSGIGDIFSTDSFHGFFCEKKGLLSGGRYRPLTLAYFAILWDLFGENAFVGHFSNVLMYGFLCLLIYYFLNIIKPWKAEKKTRFWAFIGALIFAVHPTHTEVVANIKGLDEIWSLGFGLLAAIFTFRYIDERNRYFFLFPGLFLFLALLSKENSIAFLGIILLSLWFLRRTSFKISIPIFAMLVLFAGVYVILRTSIVGLPGGSEPLEMMNNPFMKMENGVYYPFSLSERWATIIYGLGKYVQLLFFPHPLTHDYYPRHFDVMTFSNPAVLFALAMNVMIILFALIDFSKKTLISFSALFYLLSIGLTSNILFPIGTHLSERFLFTPSLAFAMLISGLAIKSYRPKRIVPVIGALSLLIVLFSIKTITRNAVWKNDFVLFTSDVQTSPNSTKVRNAAGGALLTRASELQNESEAKNVRMQAKSHLQKALKIHPNYKNAHLLLGNAYFGLDEYESAILSYERALELDLNYKIAEQNLVLAYREGGRYEGSVNGNINKAIQYLLKADILDPRNYETISLLGIAYGNGGQHRKALDYFQNALNIQPENARAHLNLSSAYRNIGNIEQSEFYTQKAKQIDPTIRN